MAERRMFAKTIIDSDAFIDMPLSTQALYFHLSMRADDDGFINNPRKIQRMVGASEDDLKLLIAKNFIIPFESGIVVIKHWKIHNYIRNDRYKETVYQEELSMLETKENNSYTLGIPNDNQVTYQMETQDRLGKDRLGKDRLGKDRLGKDRLGKDIVSKDTIRQTESVRLAVDEWNQLSVYGIATISRVGTSSKRYKSLVARINEYGIDDVLSAIGNIKYSPFLQGKNNTGWTITFDWFVKPNNFPKVLEGNYLDKSKKEFDFMEYAEDEKEDDEPAIDLWSALSDIGEHTHESNI